jgi:hypothetical protein
MLPLAPRPKPELVGAVLAGLPTSVTREAIRSPSHARPQRAGIDDSNCRYDGSSAACPEEGRLGGGKARAGAARSRAQASERRASR